MKILLWIFAAVVSLQCMLGVNSSDKVLTSSGWLLLATSSLESHRNPTSGDISSIPISTTTSTYVGSFLVSNGPYWGSSPSTYSCEEACAAIYGGSSSDYYGSISSSYISRTCYADTYAGFVTTVADTYKVCSVYSTSGCVSAYVSDHGGNYWNYCFSSGYVASPTAAPTRAPSCSPTIKPTSRPSVKPTVRPSSSPTIKPTFKPTVMPTLTPGVGYIGAYLMTDGPAKDSSPATYTCEEGCAAVFGGPSSDYIVSISSWFVSRTCYADTYGGSVTTVADTYKVCSEYSATGCVSAYVSDHGGNYWNYCFTANYSLSPTMAPTVWSGYVYRFSLLTSDGIPSLMTWYGGASLTYQFADTYSLGVSSIEINGDAGSTGRGLESNVNMTGNFYVWVSFYQEESCSDAGISVFPSQNTWNWGTATGRIAVQVNCGTPVIYGQSYTSSYGSAVISTGSWYTMVLYHNPSTYKTYGYWYSGVDSFTSSASPIATLSISESFSMTSLKFGICADEDTTSYWTQFQYLTSSYSIPRVSGVSGSPTRSPTKVPTMRPTPQPSFAATLPAGVAYIGSFLVSDGPYWGSSPPTYSCKEACAAIFGGSSSYYNGSLSSSSVTGTCYADTYAGFVTTVADTYKMCSEYSTSGCVSAYVSDHGGYYTNYCYSTKYSLSPTMAPTPWNRYTYQFSLLTSDGIPSQMTWYGGASLTYQFADTYSLGVSSIEINGNAGTTGRGLESNVYMTGDFYVWVSFYQEEPCSNAGISVFPSQNTWNWGAASGRIALQGDCGYPQMYGQSKKSTSGVAVLYSGSWYTMVLYHNPSSGMTYGYWYSGVDSFSLSASPIMTMSISESFSWTPLKFGICADETTMSYWTQFQYLTSSYSVPGASSKPSMSPTMRPSESISFSSYVTLSNITSVDISDASKLSLRNATAVSMFIAIDYVSFISARLNIASNNSLTASVLRRLGGVLTNTSSVIVELATTVSSDSFPEYGSASEILNALQTSLTSAFSSGSFQSSLLKSIEVNGARDLMGVVVSNVSVGSDTVIYSPTKSPVSSSKKSFLTSIDPTSPTFLGALIGSVLGLICIAGISYTICCRKKDVNYVDASIVDIEDVIMNGESSAPNAPPLYEEVPNISEPAFEDDEISSIMFVEEAYNGGVIHELPFGHVEAWCGNFDESLIMGRGRFGKVYRGSKSLKLSSGDSIQVAIKLLVAPSDGGSAEMSGSRAAELAEETSNLRREIKVLSNFRHPNIIRLLGYCNQSMAHLCLVFEMAEFGDLYKALKNNELACRLNWKTRVRVALGIASALNYLHCHDRDHPAFHRDVKSANIVLMSDFTSKLIDCGLAKYMRTDEQMQEQFGMTMATTVGQRYGTAGYMCPRYSKTGIYDAKAEVFSFGIVLLELFTGVTQGTRHGNVSLFLDEELERGSQFECDIRSEKLEKWHVECKERFLSLARQCVVTHDERIGTMMDVVRELRLLEQGFCQPSIEDIKAELDRYKTMCDNLKKSAELENVRRLQEAAEKKRECVICFDDTAIENGIECRSTDKHFVCRGCFGDQIRSQISPQHRGDFCAHHSKIFCVMCYVDFNDADVALTATLEDYSRYRQVYEEVLEMDICKREKDKY